MGEDSVIRKTRQKYDSDIAAAVEYAKRAISLVVETKKSDRDRAVDAFMAKYAAAVDKILSHPDKRPVVWQSDFGQSLRLDRAGDSWQIIYTDDNGVDYDCLLAPLRIRLVVAQALSSLYEVLLQTLVDEAIELDRAMKGLSDLEKLFQSEGGRK